MVVYIKYIIGFIIVSSCNFVTPIFAGQQLDEQFISILSIDNNDKHELKIKKTKNNEKNIDELGFILYDLVRKKEFDKIETIIFLYKSDHQHDENLVKYIYAEKALVRREYEIAIGFYNEILAVQPDLPLIEIKLALALIGIKRYEDALLVYQTLLTKYKNKLSVSLSNFISSQIILLETKNHWQGTIKLGASYDFNLNEASNSNNIYCFRSKCMGSSKKAIAGGEWHYSIELSKRYPLLGNHVGQFSFNIVGLEPMKTVSTKKISVLLNGGYQFEGANKKIQLLPIVETKWHDNQYHSLKLGARIAVEYEFTPQVILFGGVELKNKNYIDKYNFNDGNKLSYSLISGYFLNPNLLFFSGIDVIKREKKFKSDSYLQYGTKIGLLTVVDPYKLLVVTGYKYTEFKQFDDYLNTKRSDHNWYLNTQLTLEKHKVLSFTPAVYFNSQINKSTAHIIYSFKQSEVGVNFSKKF
ncbi:TPA: DUF560 domain-containing protein [Providencia rettgeri]|nr:DUF560 domain-containing protein [Providencia rettgeri]